MLSKKFLISMQREKFELYCHKHKHKTKILGYKLWNYWLLKVTKGKEKPWQKIN